VKVLLGGEQKPSRKYAPQPPDPQVEVAEEASTAKRASTVWINYKQKPETSNKDQKPTIKHENTRSFSQNTTVDNGAKKEVTLESAPRPEKAPRKEPKKTRETDDDDEVVDTEEVPSSKADEEVQSAIVSR
jgi:hypothetical protein